MISDIDGNELLFWLPEDDFTGFESADSPESQ